MAANYLAFSFGLILLMLLSFGGLQWLHLSTGGFLDWVIAFASFGWLLVIVTVPWNIYFDAKEALAEADLSADGGIAVDPKQVAYIQVVATRSLWVVIGLHLLSAVVLYGLARAGISPVGYIGSGAALLLTALRPAVRTYQYFATRIALLRQQFQYPREDVVTLGDRLNQLEITVKQLETQLNSEDPRSWVASQQRETESIRQELIRLATAQADLRSTNQAEHDRLSREAQQAIAQLTADGQFLEHVREIIRFFKTA